MNRSAKAVLRKLGQDSTSQDANQEHVQKAIDEKKAHSSAKESSSSFEDATPEMLTETEKRHEQYRRRQSMAGRFPPAAERLPIMTQAQREARNKDRPNWNASSFEGPIEKLVEKYKDLNEVKRHLTLGQSMKYEFTTEGQILDKNGDVLYDGEKFLK
jgi:hypothetical protein